ncbi:MAG: hypothetical protein KatS3mg057_0975 [Herpetosiphonaceae bacterium]|nr:MAG: hypothetical protein KatS3mg057_0975 [Herpetosiphonaceae bacterium]
MSSAAMTIEQAIDELQNRILAVDPGAVIRLQRRSGEEAVIRAYVPADQVEAVQDAVRDRAIELLTSQGLDVQVLVYDKETSLR